MQQFLQQLINGLSWGAILALIAVGYTMVYGVLRLINFAHGDIYMIGALGGWYVSTHWYHIDHPSWAAFFLILSTSVIACAALGFLIELIAYRPLRGQPRITSLITAIGVSLFLEYGGQQFFGASPQAFPHLIPNLEANPQLFHLGEVIVNKVDAIIFTITLLLMIGLWYLVMRTKWGLALRAVSFRFDTAALMGININRIVSLTFILGSVLAAMAGILIAIRNNKVEPLMGLQPGIKAFIAAVLGGIGNIPGAVAGGFLLGMTEVLVAGYLPQGSQYKDGIAFVILIAVLLLKPSGLFGQNVIEKV